MTMAVRGAAAALALQSLWIAIGGVVMPFLLELASFEDEPCQQGCINGWVLALGDLAIGLVLALASIRLMTIGARRTGTAGWLTVAGVANLALAGFWAVMFAGPAIDASSGLPFIAIAFGMAALCLGLAWANRPAQSER
jgi:hypothetical protein